MGRLQNVTRLSSGGFLLVAREFTILQPVLPTRRDYQHDRQQFTFAMSLDIDYSPKHHLAHSSAASTSWKRG